MNEVLPCEVTVAFMAPRDEAFSHSDCVHNEGQTESWPP